MPRVAKNKTQQKDEKSMAKGIHALIKEGKKQGFVTQDDILNLFPHAENHIAEVDELYATFIEEGVDVFETVLAGMRTKRVF
jgi:predicted Rossmann fold nucleotide-binding protein DprA/Smf involved in DNA uptake